jgi:hypothetical protein
MLLFASAATSAREHARTAAPAPAPSSQPASVVAAAAPAAAMVETATVRETLPTGTNTAAAAPAAGLRAFIDPATGKFTTTPTRAQIDRLALEARSATLSRSVSGLRPFELSRGGRGLNLQGRFQTALRVVRGADGRLYQTCGDPAHDHTTNPHHESASSEGGDSMPRAPESVR